MRVAPLYPKETHGSMQDLVGHPGSRFGLLKGLDEHGITGTDTQHMANIDNDLTNSGPHQLRPVPRFAGNLRHRPVLCS